VPGTDFSARSRFIKAGREAAQAMIGELRLRILTETR